MIKTEQSDAETIWVHCGARDKKSKLNKENGNHFSGWKWAALECGNFSLSLPHQRGGFSHLIIYSLLEVALHARLRLELFCKFSVTKLSQAYGWGELKFKWRARASLFFQFSIKLERQLSVTKCELFSSGVEWITYVSRFSWKFNLLARNSINASHPDLWCDC